MPNLVAWLGNADLRASESRDLAAEGPILSAIKAFAFEAVHLLSDHSMREARA